MCQPHPLDHRHNYSVIDFAALGHSWGFSSVRKRPGQWLYHTHKQHFSSISEFISGDSTKEKGSTDLYNSQSFPLASMCSGGLCSTLFKLISEGGRNHFSTYSMWKIRLHLIFRYCLWFPCRKKNKWIKWTSHNSLWGAVLTTVSSRELLSLTSTKLKLSLDQGCQTLSFSPGATSAIQVPMKGQL